MSVSTNNPVPWPDNKNDYDLLDIIGVGSTAVVFSAFCPLREEKCAVKRINLEKCNIFMEELLKEVQVMSRCNHENVVTYYASFIASDELWLVLKLLEGGSLLDVIKHKMKVSNCKHGVFDEATIATVLKEVLRGLEYLHSNGQIHRDVKAGNILLGDDGTVQIADIGLTAWLATGRDKPRLQLNPTFLGTPCWMAPEVIKQSNDYDYKADIWSFGITAIEMAAGKAPYHKHPPMRVLLLTLQNDPPSLETGAAEKNQYRAYGKTFRKMVTDCLQKDPSKRPTATELLGHPFFRKAKDRKYLTQTLVAIAPSMGTRVQKASKRQPGASCRLHRDVPGEFEWGAEEGALAGAVEDGSRPLKELFIPDSSSGDNEEEDQKLGKDGAAKVDVYPESKPCAEEKQKDADDVDTATTKATSSKKEIHLVLRLRNKRNELNDIGFEFVAGKDTARGVAAALVCAGLLDPRDSVAVAINLAKLLESQAINENAPSTVTFHLNPTSPNEQFDDKALIGFAQISITDE